MVGKKAALKKDTSMTDSLSRVHAPVSVSTMNQDKDGRPRRPRSQYGSNRAVSLARVLFLTSLSTMAALLAIGFYFLLRDQETSLALAQYDAIAVRALDSMFEIAQRKRLGTISMASVASNANPDADQWPFVFINGFEHIAERIIATSSGREMGFCPIVLPEQVEEFEDFAYQYYYEDRKPETFPNTTAVSPFGRGVWGIDSTGNKYHAADGNTTYGSPNQIITPILHHDKGIHPVLMLNVRFEKTRGVAIDSIIECSKERALQENPDNVDCGAITDMVILAGEAVEPGPGALIMQPIYPANNPTELTGLLASSIVWDEVLFKVFSAEVSGIDVVLETETQVYTYSISGGVATLKGEGDLHRSGAFVDENTRQVVLTGEGQYNEASAEYRLSIYPTDEFVSAYRTANPAMAALGAAMCIFLTAMLFILYDSRVREEVNARTELLEAKRKFVRFVSHEVRTPLNSVCMGLGLMLEEIEAALGVESIDGPLKGNYAVDEEHAQDWLNLGQEVLLNAQSSVDVLNDLLNYDKVEMGTLKLELSVIPIWQLIESVRNEFLLPAAAKKISYKLNFGKQQQADLEAGNPSTSARLPQDVKDMKVVGDSIRTAQVMRNLISNAIKFTNDGGSMTIDVSWTRDVGGQAPTTTFLFANGTEAAYQVEGNLTVSVTDSGAGMTKDQVDKLFRDGVQFNVNELQSGNGSGLGLYIAKGIVTQHGGQLSATSKGLGLGTTFTMTLPLYNIPDLKRPRKEFDRDETVESELSADSASRQREIQSTYLNILIVDDAGSNRKLLRRLLENHGHSTVEAENGREAMCKEEEARQKGTAFDCILLDNEMPIMNGPEACREMRSRGCDAFIVGVTGNLMAEDIEIFREAGANSVLAKPFRLAALDQLWLEHGVLGSRRPDSDSESNMRSA